MAVNGDGVSNPLCDVVVIDYSPVEALGRFPAFFSRLHYLDIPMHAELIDPVGNLNVLRIEMIGDRCYFTDGWVFLGKFYGIQSGAYILLDYVRRGCFEITIKSYKWVDWIYPPIPEPLEGGFGSGCLNERLGHEHCLIFNNNAFHLYVVKWVSFAEFTGDVLTLPPEFSGPALVDAETDIYIVDEFRKRWPCIFRRGYGDQVGKWVICKGWAKFCRHKDLKQGQKIKFGVTCGNSNQLHFNSVV